MGEIKITKEGMSAYYDLVQKKIDNNQCTYQEVRYEFCDKPLEKGLRYCKEHKYGRNTHEPR